MVYHDWQRRLFVFRGPAMAALAGCVLLAALFMFGPKAASPGFCADAAKSNEGRSVPDEDRGTAKQPEGPAADLGDLFSYEPPKRGRPSNRIGGGVRALTTPGVLVALTPQGHIGVTIDPSPSFHWFVHGFSETTKVVLTLTDFDSPEPLVNQTFEIPAGGGIQSLRLSDAAITLEEGKEYEWIVEAFDKNDRYTPTRASGGRLIFDRSASIEAAAGSSPLERASSFGAQGLWYDCLAALDAAMGDEKAAPRSRTQRIKLMKDSGLVEEIVKAGYEGSEIDGVPIR